MMGSSEWFVVLLNEQGNPCFSDSVLKSVIFQITNEIFHRGAEFIWLGRNPVTIFLGKNLKNHQTGKEYYGVSDLLAS